MLICIGIVVLIKCLNIKSHNNQEDKQIIFEATSKIDSIAKANKLYLFEFNPNLVDSSQISKLNIPSYVKRNIINYRSKGGKFRNREDIRKIYGMNDSIYSMIESFIIIPITQETEIVKNNRSKKSSYNKRKLFHFNPNIIDSLSLDSLNIPSYIKRNILNYRSKGGKYYTKEDVKKIYGMNDSIYMYIEPFINIPHNEKVDYSALRSVNNSTKIELNSCTAEELSSINGIGEVLSSRIIKYRNLLGGFISVEQLNEVYGLDKNIINANSDLFTINKLKIICINVNFASKKELLKHPYIDMEIANDIVNYRSKVGNIEKDKFLKDSIINYNNYKMLQYYLEY